MDATTRVRGWIDEQITAEHLADYLTADRGHTIGLYRDGTVSVGESIGREIAEDERPIATAKCPGIGNLDSTYWTADFATWDDERGAYVVTGRYHEDRDRVIGNLEDVIRECCRDGDVEDERQALVDRLTDDAEQCGFTVPVELAVETEDGWLFLEEVDSRDAAIEAARAWASRFYQDGKAVFGISDDPHSGHYEDRLTIFRDGGEILA